MSDGRAHFEVVDSACGEAAGKVDILVVVDDSPSMAAHADALGDNLRRFARTYERTGFPIDWRIAFTTSSVTSPHCEAPGRDGALLDTSCRERLDDFVAPSTHESEGSDERTTCLNHCPLGEVTILETTTPLDPVPKRRPWIEHGEGIRNTPELVDVGDAFACLGQVGVAGCTFESPIDAALAALNRAENAEDPAWGFMRDDAALFVLFITDEGDCSVQPEQADAFDPDGSRALWPEGAGAPTSAVCFNAGVSCFRGSDSWEECRAANVGRQGAIVDGEDAVLRPVDELVDLLSAIERHKREAQRSPWQRVFVSVVGGVDGAGEIRFDEALDEATELAFGVNPGCRRGGEFARQATPPFRLWEVGQSFEEFGAGAMSICDDSWEGALACVPSMPQVRSVCAGRCARDLDPSTIALEGNCVVTDVPPGEHAPVPLPPCIPVCGSLPCELGREARADDYEVPGNAHACAVWRNDIVGESPGHGDDVGVDCTDDGHRLEVHIVRRSVQDYDGGCVTVRCEGALDHAETCF